MADEPGQLGEHPAIARLRSGSVDAATIDALRHEVTGTDLTSLLLDVMQHRADGRTPGDVLRQYEDDRFTAPSPVNARSTLAASAAAVEAIGTDFELLDISPLAPLGTSSVVAGVSQNRVVTTTRSTEVASDPTNSLALEAASRRRAILRGDPRSATCVRLATVDRVVRAQRFDGPRSFQHFTLLGLVSAGRDIGNHTFESAALIEHISALIAACQACGHKQIEIRLTDFDGGFAAVVERVLDGTIDVGVTAHDWPDRPTGRGYYPTVCFKLAIIHDGESIEVGDGGLTEWTQSLVGSRKERLMTSGLSLERLAMF